MSQQRFAKNGRRSFFRAKVGGSGKVRGGPDRKLGICSPSGFGRHLTARPIARATFVILLRMTFSVERVEFTIILYFLLARGSARHISCTPCKLDREQSVFLARAEML